MKQDDVIRLAKKAGFAHGISCFAAVEEDIIAFAKLVAEHEREACAKVAFVYDAQPWKHEPAYAHVADMVSVEIGKAIRARGQA